MYPGAIVEIQRAASDLKTLVDRAIDAAAELRSSWRRRRNLSTFERNDRIWVVFDIDDRVGIDEAVRICAEYGIGVGRSNPCFEIWLILHEEDFNKSDDGRRVQRHLQSLRPEYDPKGRKLVNFDEIIQRLQMAEARAERQLSDRFAEGVPYGRPSTTVFQLTHEIRVASDQWNEARGW